MNVHVRPAHSLDAGATGGILHSFNCEAAWMPDLYSGAETISFCASMIARNWVRVAVSDDQLVGFIARDGDEICSLFVAAQARSAGVGKRLLEDAKSECDQLKLWTFQANNRARIFYEREGFVCTAHSDGNGNDEKLPDLKYEWRRVDRNTEQRL